MTEAERDHSLLDISALARWLEEVRQFACMGLCVRLSYIHRSESLRTSLQSDDQLTHDRIGTGIVAQLDETLRSFFNLLSHNDYRCCVLRELVATTARHAGQALTSRHLFKLRKRTVRIHRPDRAW